MANNEEIFFDAFTDRINLELDKCYHPKAAEQADYIATGEDMVALAQAGVFFAGIASAPFTFGLGLAAAGASIVIIKAGKFCVDKYIDARTPPQELPPDYLNNQRKLQRLALFILLRQVSFDISKRYKHAMNGRLDADNVQKFGQYVAHRVMKKLYAELIKNPHTLPSVKSLVDYFLESVQHSGLLHTEEIALQPLEGASPMRLAALSHKIPIKQFCARQRILAYNEQGVRVYAAETTPFYDQFQTNTTREDLGYISVLAQELPSLSLAINTRILKEFTIPAAKQQQVVSESSFPHFVTRDEIGEYTAAYQLTPSLSLNDFLTQKYQRPTIACCHNDDLKGMTFVGNYSHVNFYEADLSDCNFTESDFNHANLTRAKMIRIKTSPKTNFQNMYAEGSLWMGEDHSKLVLEADISHGKFQGSTWIKCQISTLAKQMGSEWEMAVTDSETIMVDVSKEDFELRLQAEHEARVECNKRMDDIEKRCKTIEETTKTQAQNAQSTEHEIQQLRQELSSLQQGQVSLERRMNHRLDCINEQLANLTKATSDNTQAIEGMEERLTEVVNKQKIRDSDQDEQIAAIAARQSAIDQQQSVYTVLQQYCMTEIYTDDYRTKTETHIPLLIKSKQTDPTEATLLTSYLYNTITQAQHIVSDPLFIFVTGDSGCGKTFEVTRFGEAINAMNSLTHPWVFIPLDASTIIDKSSNICNSALNKIMNTSQKAELAQNPCIIHLSKLDISNISADKLISDCKAATSIWTAPVIFIFTARDRYLDQARAQIDKLTRANPNRFLECVLQPLSDEQIHTFFQYFPKHQLSELWTTYHQQGILNFNSLGRTPLVLTVMTGILIEYANAKGPRTPMHKTEFYRASWRALFERVKHKLPEQYQTYSKFMEEMYNLSKAMLKSKLDCVVFSVQEPGPSSKKEPLHELLETRMGALSPLSIVKNDANTYTVRFIHPSFGFFLNAEILIENLFKPDFPNKETQNLWGRNYLRITPEILDCLVELLQQYPERETAVSPTIKMLKHNSFDESEIFSTASEGDSDDETPIRQDKAFIQERLLELVRKTHVSVPNRGDNRRLSSNAFTLLCRWGRNLSTQDFSQLILHFVDATNALLPYMNGEQTDFSGSCFYNAMIYRANLRKSILNQTRFLNATRFLEMGNVSKTFMIYPTANQKDEIVVAYPLPPDSNTSKHQNAIVKIRGEQVALLKAWPAHDQEITAMAITLYETETRFASVGLGGTVRVWRLTAEAPPQEIAKLRSRKHREPIDHLVWGPDGNLLATGDKKGFVRIWDINTKDRVFKSLSHTSEITALVWGRMTQTLFASAGSALSSWSYDDDQGITDENINLPNSNGYTFSSLALSSHETHLAMGTHQGQILIFALRSKQFIQTLQGHKNRVTSLVWRENLLSSSQDHTIRIWPSEDTEGSIFQHDHPIGKVDMLADGQIISGIDPESTRLYFWDPNQPKTYYSYTKSIGVISSMAASPTAEHIAIGDAKGDVYLYPLQDMEQPDAPAPLLIMSHNQASIQNLFWSWNGQYLVSVGQDQIICIKDISNSSKPVLITKPINIWPTHLTWYTDAEEDTENLIIGYSDGSLGLYTNQNIFSTGVTMIPCSPASSITWLSSRATAPQLAIASGQRLLLHTPKTAITDSISTHPNHPPKMLVWSPNGNYLVSCDEMHSLYIWDASTVRLTILAQYSAQEIKSVLWTNDWLIVGNSKEIFYWKVSNGTEILTTTPTRIPLRVKYMANTDTEHLVVARSTGIFFFPQTDLHAAREQPDYQWQFQRLKAGFCADGCDITGSSGASRSTEFYLGRNGVDTKVSSSFFSFSGNTTPRASLSESTEPLPELLPNNHVMRLFTSKLPKQPLIGESSEVAEIVLTQV